MQATDVYEAVAGKAEEIRNDELQVAGTMSVGDEIRQGDIYIQCIEKMPDGYVIGGSRQLAPGTTQGSRHIVEGDVEIRRYKGGDALQGPYLRAKEAFTVTHPEHGDWRLPAGLYSVTYQRKHADELRRIED